MKINLDVNELRALVQLLTPQVTVIDNGVPQVSQQSPTAPLPTVSEVQTSEADYFATVSKYSEPSASDKAAALQTAIANGFEYEVPKKNGETHTELADKISAANSLLPGN